MNDRDGLFVEKESKVRPFEWLNECHPEMRFMWPHRRGLDRRAS